MTTPAIDMNSPKINVYVFNRNTGKGFGGWQVRGDALELAPRRVLSGQARSFQPIRNNSRETGNAATLRFVGGIRGNN